MRPEVKGLRETTEQDYQSMPKVAIVDAEEADWVAGLAKLREPFPPEQIGKLPKGGRTLDYVGHGYVTDRLLEVDPCWDWEPMAYTEEGLPLFSNGGLWIKLTILGVTRIGFGDGNSVKEVIGDAIRNAAMRFGVALDLWCKGDPDFSPATPTRGHAEQGRRRDNGGRRQTEGEGAVAADRAPNQDALDELGSACDRHGYDRRSCGPMFAEWAEQQPPPGPTRRLIDAMADDIREFTKYLIAMATADPTGEAGSEVEGSEIPGDDGGAGAGDSAGAATGVAGTGEDGLRRESASPAAVDTEGGAPGSPAEVLGKPESDPERMF